VKYSELPMADFSLDDALSFLDDTSDIEEQARKAAEAQLQQRHTVIQTKKQVPP